ncbi:Hypp7087 [Branchiostoma lanceolatum]|uniref:Hypp7087 protein n=1 Tax=Branchiostoma lanceolatum TaxID=7740 RepID=A0A8J9YXD6_BRALA|nr:Hypp7087 [Branchiostoma lanceolatum]
MMEMNVMFVFVGALCLGTTQAAMHGLDWATVQAIHDAAVQALTEQYFQAFNNIATAAGEFTYVNATCARALQGSCGRCVTKKCQQWAMTCGMTLPETSDMTMLGGQAVQADLKKLRKFISQGERLDTGRYTYISAPGESIQCAVDAASLAVSAGTLLVGKRDVADVICDTVGVVGTAVDLVTGGISGIIEGGVNLVDDAISAIANLFGRRKRDLQCDVLQLEPAASCMQLVPECGGECQGCAKLANTAARFHKSMAKNSWAMRQSNAFMTRAVTYNPVSGQMVAEVMAMGQRMKIALSGPVNPATAGKRLASAVMKKLRQ